MASDIRLFRNDVLITKKPVNEVRKSDVIVKMNDEQEEAINFFEVLRVGPETEHVSVGDIILVRYAEHTPVFDWNGKQVAVTEETRIEGVIEND